MKHVTLSQLIESVPASGNYTFTMAPDSDSRNYDDNMWGDIVSNLIDHCGGEFGRVLNCYINHFDAADNYLETYALELTDAERAELEGDCTDWLAEGF